MPIRRADKFISVEQVAEMIGLARKTILAKKCGTDELLRVKLGKKTVYSHNDVEAWIKRRIQAARKKKDKLPGQSEQTNVIPLQRDKFKREEIREILLRGK